MLCNNLIQNNHGHTVRIGNEIPFWHPGKLYGHMFLWPKPCGLAKNTSHVGFQAGFIFCLGFSVFSGWFHILRNVAFRTRLFGDLPTPVEAPQEVYVYKTVLESCGAAEACLQSRDGSHGMLRFGPPLRLGPPVFSPCFFWLGGSNRLRKRGTLILASLLEDVEGGL